MNTRKVGCLELTTFMGALCFVDVVRPDDDSGVDDDHCEELVGDQDWTGLVEGLIRVLGRFKPSLGGI